MLKVEEPIWNRSSLGCHAAPIKNGSSISPISVNGIHRAERRRVHWLSSLRIYFHACDVSSENKTWCFFPRQKSRRCLPGGGASFITGIFALELSENSPKVCWQHPLNKLTWVPISSFTPQNIQLLKTESDILFGGRERNLAGSDSCMVSEMPFCLLWWPADQPAGPRSSFSRARSKI